MAPPGGASAYKPPSMRALTARLKEIQLSYNDIYRFTQTLSETTSLTEVEVRMEKLDELWESYSDALVEIFAHEDYNPEKTSFEKERQEFSNGYYQVKSLLTDKVKEFQGPIDLNQSIRVGEGAVPNASDRVRLPQIKLQTFNGNIDDWLSFRVLFTSLIHWKPDLPEVEKLHYLKSCLQGEPKALIDPLPITRANYTVAWDLLLKRYNNSKQLRKRQVQALFKLPSLSKESGTDLHALLEGFERIVQTLDQMIQENDYKDLLLVHILTSRMDAVTRRGWEEASSSKEQDTLEELIGFLRRRIQVLDSLPTKSTDTRGIGQVQQQLKPKQTIKTSFTSSQASRGRCVACSSDHLLFQCSEFQQMRVSDRDGLLKSHGLCRNCFRAGHQAKECQSRYSCRNCKGRHHTLVCFKQEKDKDTKVMAVAGGNKPCSSQDQQEPTNIQVANMAATETAVSASIHRYPKQVLLATAIVLIEDDIGNRLPARALLDSGSESNFMTERLSQRLHVHRERVDICVSGIGQAATKVRQQIRAALRSRISDFSRDLGFLVLPQVTVNLPTTQLNVYTWTIPNGIQLADPAYFEPNAVDIVLGIECFFDFFETGRRISLGENLPTLNESVFGWIISGGISAPTRSLRVSCNVSALENLETLVTRFWSCEEVDPERAYSPEELRCEKWFSSTVQRNTDGRYTVALPKAEDAVSRLGQSKEIAFRRLQGTERRLAGDSLLREQYVAFMAEYIKLGHMRMVDEDAEKVEKRCYLPHHPVVKEASTTTKVRVVFDASCRTSSGTSLNDVLLVGPVVQEDLRSIILRCRTKQIMLVSDVEKMFRQINIRPEDRPLQCILWRCSPLEIVHTYELNTVTYGTKPAPFLATRTLQQLALDEEARFPLAARAATEDTYMDDIITGTDDVDTATELQIQLNTMLYSGGFKLRKWASNCPSALVGVPEENLAIRTSDGINLDPDPSVKTLGLTWVPSSDILRFQFSIVPLDHDVILTKRTVFSVIATLFDPLGLLGAVITTAKRFMQILWTTNDVHGKPLGWDQPLPPTVGEMWTKFHEQLPLLHEIRIERCVMIPKPATVEIHCFSDASEKAYGACLYVRSIDASGHVLVRLLSSKSKVAPLKCQTIPRLELCGALLAAQLFKKVCDSIRINADCYFWTDSTCVLSWITATPSTWTTFVANRTAKIQTITEGFRWSHVPGTQNPADLISRGITPQDILDNNLWWKGPSWLQDTTDHWPGSLENSSMEEVDKERRRTILAATVSKLVDFNQEYFRKFSSYFDLVRRTAYWLRLMKLLRKPSSERSDPAFLSTLELREAEDTLVRLVQREVFAEEIKALSKGELVHRGSSLRWFNPYLCKNELLKLGGRLKNSMEPEEAKHPVVLPARHPFTQLLLKYYHERLLHAGPQLMMSVIRLRFWPLGGRSVMRNIVHQCQRCVRSKPSPIQQFMGDLPASRVIANRPFSNTGVDYFGPIYLRPVPRRAAFKAYVAIFICMCTKAVHLELVSDLSTERFIQALRRFISRRGRCTIIYSDNGTNFVGARNKLEDLLKLQKTHDHQEAVAKECAKEGIQWQFIPPSAPHFGGLWEAAVRSAKYHLLRVVGETPVPPEDYRTLLVQVEACLNSRPLTPLSDDPNDLEPLTPAHFLIGSSLQSIPEPDLRELPINRLDAFQLSQRRFQDFWKRWHREYLCQLQARTKRWQPAVQIEIGKLVIIKDENQSPLKWRMGRIKEVYPGRDGVVRVVTLKTSNGLLTRPVEKLCILPFRGEDDYTRPNESRSSTQ